MNFIWFTLIVISNLFLLCFGSDKLNVKSKPIDNLYKRVCVYPNWTVLRPKKIAKLFPDEIDPYMCTHIHYAYANINVRTLELVPSLKQDTLNGSHGAPLYERIIKLRELNPQLKILISIGGYFARSTSFDQIVSSEVKRKKFVANVMKFLSKWQFDGLDVHWFYPGDGSASDSKLRFTTLLQSLNLAFKHKLNSKEYLLSIFAPSDETQIDAGYQVKFVCQYLDYLTVETYDYSIINEKKTSYNSPLYSRSAFPNSVNSSINSWTQRGCPKNKLLVGISTYARAFKLLIKTNSLAYFGAEAEPYMAISNYTREEGTLSYSEVCEMIQSKYTKSFWDHKALVSFAIVKKKEYTFEAKSFSLWITYEDSKSARKKAEYVKNNTLAGVTFWTIDMDDFTGSFCKIDSFPIISSVKDELENNLIPSPKKLTILINEAMKSTKLISVVTETTKTSNIISTTRQTPVSTNLTVFQAIN